MAVYTCGPLLEAGSRRIRSYPWLHSRFLVTLSYVESFQYKNNYIHTLYICVIHTCMHMYKHTYKPDLAL